MSRMADERPTPETKPAAKLNLDTEELAGNYDKDSNNQLKSGLELLAQLKLTPGERVLDVGTGTGILAHRAAEQVGEEGRVIGIDPLQLRISIASEKTRPNLSFAVGDAQDLSEFAPASFDVAYMNAVFHWLPDQQAALHQVARILKPGGRLGMTVVSSDHPHAATDIRTRVFSRERYRGYSDGAKRDYAKFLKKAELESLLERAGFGNLDIGIGSSVTRKETSKDVLAYLESSSFGNFIQSLPAGLRESAKEEVLAEFEQLRTDKGIAITVWYYMVVAVKS